MSVYVFLADGFEEVEAITPIDFLRRAGIVLQTVSLAEGLNVVGGHGIVMEADFHLSDFNDASPEALICPGGMPGAENLAASGQLLDLLRHADQQGSQGSHGDQGAYICAICAAPAVTLGRGGADILGNRRFTCYPGFEERAGSGRHSPDRVVKDGRLITAIGAGAAAEFSFAIIEALKGRTISMDIHSSTMQQGKY